MRKYFILMLLMFLLVGCKNLEEPSTGGTIPVVPTEPVEPTIPVVPTEPVEPTNPPVNTEKGTLGILTINDLHGAIQATDKQPDIDKLAGEIRKQAESFDDCVLLAGGDMWQGTALSNINRGVLVTDIMNELKFDAMVIGNHEFDWGVDEIAKFQDGNLENGEANFPFLAANIYDNKGTSSTLDDELVPFAKPYVILEKGAWKIGVIGYIGKYQKYDIAASIVKNFDFKEPQNIVLNYANKLKEECDIVIAYGHEFEEENNTLFANSSSIDIIYNAHTHRAYIEKENNKYIVQSASNGNYLGVTSITTDGISVENIHYNSFSNSDEGVLNIVNEYKNSCYDLLYGKLSTASTYCTRFAAGRWAATAVKNYTGADFGIQNNGGIRSVAFPIDAGDIINLAKLYDMMPFDNTIWLVKMSGAKLKSILNKHEDYRSSYNLDDVNIVDNQMYVVACCDYIVDGNYDFNGLEIIKTGLLVRDAMMDDVIAQENKYQGFSPFNSCVENKYKN